MIPLSSSSTLSWKKGWRFPFEMLKRCREENMSVHRENEAFSEASMKGTRGGLFLCKQIIRANRKRVACIFGIDQSELVPSRRLISSGWLTKIKRSKKKPCSFQLRKFFVPKDQIKTICRIRRRACNYETSKSERLIYSRRDEMNCEIRSV